MSDETQVKRATLTDQTRPNATPIEVHFNPSSLQLTVTSVSKPEGKSAQKTQHVGTTTTTLGMDLIFDTTDTGQDVRADTSRVARLMAAVAPKAATPTKPVVVFEWGTFRFQGIMESYTETIDFFSPDGVPLRATVKLSFTKQDEVFASPGAGSSVAAALDSVEAPAGPSANVTQVAQQAGDADTSGRWLAAANDLETMRFPTASLTIDLGVSLSPPVAFASGAELGLKVNGGVSLGMSAGLGVSGPRFGGAASAGISASAGAFAGLRATPSSRASRSALDPARLLGDPGSASVATQGYATFRVGGAGNVEGTASLATDVGAALATPPRIQFEGE